MAHPRACGENRCTASASRLPVAHPRACGEDNAVIFLISSATGSPPRMRGKCRGAGCNSPPVQAHPRACGEDIGRKNDSLQHAGSPPRMRGKLERSLFQRYKPGLTPAHAGRSCWTFSFFTILKLTPAHTGKSCQHVFPILTALSSPHPYVFFPPIPFFIALFTASASFTRKTPEYVTVNRGIHFPSLTK